MTKTVIGVFHDRDNVEEAMDKFRNEGFNPKDISIVMKDTREAKDVGDHTGADVVGGAATGATTGAVVGGIAGLVAGILIPGLGAFLIGGPIAAALGLGGAAAATVSGAATGAVAGGLLGALMGLGLSEDEAEYYEGKVKEGAILLAVPARDDQVSWVKGVFDECDANDIKTVAPTGEALDRSRRDDRAYEDTRSYATMGTKGGKTKKTTTDTNGPGWRGESDRHAKAAKGEESTREDEE